jgi:phosphate-selective porin OprO/OprP
MERPFHVEAFNQDARRVGIASYGRSESDRWTWRYGYYLMDDLSANGFQRTDNYQSEFTGRLANTIWYDEVSGGRGYAHWAVSGSLAFPGGGPDGRFLTRPEARTGEKWLDTGDLRNWNSYQLLGLEGVVNVGRLQVVGEYQTVNVDRFAGASLDFHGGYVYVAYMLTGEHVPWRRERSTISGVKPFEDFFLVKLCSGGVARGWGAWQVAARYSHADFSDQDVLGGVGDSFTFGLNWWWTTHSRWQFNYTHGRVSARDPATTGGAALPAGVANSGDYDIFGTRFLIYF